MNHAQACKLLAIGMRVRVARYDPPESRQLMERPDETWINGWNNDMRDTVGSDQVFTITEINERGVYFEEDHGCWGWPAQALEPEKLTVEIVAKGKAEVEI